MILINRLFYYGLILPISKLPFPVLYRLSDALFFILFRLVGYRKKVVYTNIKKSFPEKTAQEHSAIANEFYRHFCDLVFESLKTFSITKEEVHERMKALNPEVVNSYFEKGKSVILAGGHYNNWELFAVAIDEVIKHQTKAIYKPLSNTYFDKKMRITRGKYGLQLIHNRKVKESFEEDKDKLTAVIFAIDQSPSFHSKPYWTTFLNQDTAVLTGAEKYARDYNYPVLFGRIHKIRRGHYAFEFELVCDNPAETQPGFILEQVTQMLEKDIQKVPPYWLWSHRRWKHKKPVSQD